MRRFGFAFGLFLLWCVCNPLHAETDTAKNILAAAEAQAMSEHKSILVVFQASWCEPCKQFETFFHDDRIDPVLSRYFIIVHLRVGEELNDHAELNSPGGEALMVKFGGATSGLPFMVILDGKGQFVCNSNRPLKGSPLGQNIGYPSRPDEIAWFVMMLKKGVPSLSASDRHAVEEWLSSHVHEDE